MLLLNAVQCPCHNEGEGADGTNRRMVSGQALLFGGFAPDRRSVRPGLA
jgi:hypothetical protein